MALESTGLGSSPFHQIQGNLPSYTLGGSTCCCSPHSPQQSSPCTHSTALGWPGAEKCKVVKIVIIMRTKYQGTQKRDRIASLKYPIRVARLKPVLNKRSLSGIFYLVTFSTVGILIFRKELPIQLLLAAVTSKAVLVVHLTKSCAAIVSKVSLAVVATP